MVTKEQIQCAREGDLLSIASRLTKLKKISSKGGGEYAGPCPMCGGTDRFHIQPAKYRWFCRQCTGALNDPTWHDVIDFQMRAYGENFEQAVLSLAGGGTILRPIRFKQVATVEPSTTEPPGEKWQARAVKVTLRAQETLWGITGTLAVNWEMVDPDTGEKYVRRMSPREWLAARGLEPATLQAAQIGYIPRNWKDHPAYWGLDGEDILVPQGITIPSVTNGVIWNLKIRRPLGKPKYLQVRGGRPALYLAETLISNTAPDIACITEGEFDALILCQSLRHAINPRWRDLGVITMGSNSTHPSLDYWGRFLYPIKHFLLLYDQDGKSEKAIAYWQNLSRRTRIVQWRNLRPYDKDLSDYHVSGGRLLDLISVAIKQNGFESE